MEPSTSRQQAGSVAHFPGQASQPEELLEQCPIDFSSATNFHVKKRNLIISVLGQDLIPDFFQVIKCYLESIPSLVFPEEIRFNF